MADVRPIPDGFHSLTAHITVNGAARAIDWYTSVFDASVLRKSEMPGGGTIMHASLRIGDSILMLNDEFPPQALAPTDGYHGTTIHLYVEDVDAVVKKAMDNGATEIYPVMDTFWGDRYGRFVDPFGHHWAVATHKEDLTDAEIGQRAREFFSKAGQQ